MVKVWMWAVSIEYLMHSKNKTYSKKNVVHILNILKQFVHIPVW